MIEAQIICCNPCDIPDLGIFALKRGEQRWVADLAARNSNDLRKEQAKGNVRVNRKARRSNSNPPKRHVPPFVAHSRPQHNEGSPEPPQPQPSPPPVEKIVEKTVVQEVDTDRLKAELLHDLIPGLRSVIAEEVGKAAQQSAAQAQAAQQSAAQAQAASQQSPVDAAQLETVLESVLRRVVPEGGMVSSGASGKSRAPSGPEEPLFIPQKIVAKDTKAKIDIEQKATESGGDLDDAQAALRALRGKKRGKKTNGKKEEK